MNAYDDNDIIEKIWQTFRVHNYYTKHNESIK